MPLKLKDFSDKGQVAALNRWADSIETRLRQHTDHIAFASNQFTRVNLDKIHDGVTRFAVNNGPALKAVAAVDANNKALIDLSQAGHTNKTIDNVGDGTTYARALATALTSGQVDLSKLGVINKTLANISDSLGRYAVINGAGFNAVAAVDAANKALIDFAQSGHINKSLDNVADGVSRFGVINAGGLKGVASVDGANKALIDFSQAGHTNKTLDNVPDSALRFAIINGAGLKAVSAVDAANKALIDFSQAGHANKTLDNVLQGTNFGSVPLSNIGGGSPTAKISGYQLVSNPDFRGGSLTGYVVYDNNFTGNVTISAVADGSSPGGYGYKMKIHVAGGGESPGLGGFYYSLALDSGIVGIDKYHVGDTYVVDLVANIPSGYTVSFYNNSLGTGGSVTNLSTSYAGTGGWQHYVWKVVIGASPLGSLAFPFFGLNGTFSSAFDWYAGHLCITDIDQPMRLTVAQTDPNNLAWVDFSQTHSNKILDNIGDGATYARVLGSALSSNAINLGAAGGWANKTLDFLPNGTSNFSRTAAHSTYRPLTNPLTATDAGASATISASAFTQRVAGTDVAVSGGSLTGLAYNTLYHIYYDDATLAGGAVTYAQTQTKETAIAGAGRFYVGSILTPKATGPSTIGFNNGGAGAQVGFAVNLYAGVATLVSGTAWTNFANINDGDVTSKATFQPGGAANTQIVVSGFNGIAPAYQSIVLNIKTQVGLAGGTSTLEYSLNGGNTWTTVYSVVVARALTTDTITLSSTQNIGAVQVRYTDTASSPTSVDFYEAWLSVAG